MDKVFEKFGIYDFMGIWGPGAITVTYYLFTTRSFFSNLFSILNITQGGITQGYLLIFLYTAVAYTIGVILHELGKIIYDFFKWSDSEKITYFELNYKKKPRFLPNRRIKYDYNKSIESMKTNEDSLRSLLNKSNPNPLCFVYARARLKYDKTINTKRMDMYHSVYGLSRSLSVSFATHFIVVLISLLSDLPTINWVLLVCDVVLVLVFYCRAYRYFISWIENTYIQYFLCIYIKENANKKRKKSHSHYRSRISKI